MPDDKEPIPQFAARIKAKYPQYKDVDDTLLAKKIVEKFPEYGAMVDFGPEPSKKKEAEDAYKAGLQKLGGFFGLIPSKSESVLKGEVKSIQGTDKVEQSKEEVDPEDPLKSMMAPIKSELGERYTNYLASSKPSGKESTNQNQTSRILKDKLDRENTRRNHMDGNAIVTMNAIQKQKEHEIFPDADKAAQLLNNYAANKGIQIGDLLDPNDETINNLPKNNETIKAAVKQIDDYRKVYDELQESGGRLQEAAINRKRKEDSNYNDKLFKLQEHAYTNDYNVTVPEAERGAITYDYITNPNVRAIAEKDPELKEQYDNLVNNFYQIYPEFGKTLVANKLSQAREDKGLNNPFLNVVGKATMDKIADEVLTPQEKQVYIDKIRPDVRGTIDTPGFVENFGTSALEGVEGVKQTFQELAPGASDADLLRESMDKAAKTVQVTPKSNLNKFGNLTGKFAGMVVPIGYGGRLLQGIGVAGKATTANALMTGLTFYGQEKAHARELMPKDEVGQDLFAAGTTAAYMFASNIFKDFKALDGLTKEIRPSIQNIVKEFNAGTISKEAARDAAATAFKTAANKALELTKGTITQNTKAALEMTAIQYGKNMAEKILAPESYNEGEHDRLLANTAISTWIGTTPMGLSAAYSNVKQKPVLKESLLYAAMHPEEMKDAIKLQTVADPSFVNSQDKLANIDFLAKTKDELVKQPGMTEKKLKSYLLQSLNRKMIEDTMPEEPTLKKKAQEKIKQAEINQEEILAGKDVDELPHEQKEELPDDKLEKELLKVAPEGYKEHHKALKEEGKEAGWLGYMADKAAENPDKFIQEFGDDLFDRMIEKVGTKKLENSLNYLKDNIPEDANIPLLEQILEQRYDKKDKEVIEGDRKPKMTWYQDFVSKIEKQTTSKLIGPDEISQPIELNPNLPEGYTKPESITIKAEKNAIPEQSAEEMGAHVSGNESVGREGESVGMGSGEQGTKPPGEEKISENTGQEEQIRLSHADTKKIYKEQGLPERLETPTKKDSDLEAAADKLVKDGYDFDKESEKVMKGEKHSFTDEEQVAFAKMVGALEAKQKGLDIKSEEFQALQDKIEKYSRASDVVGTLEARAFRARQNFVGKEESLADYVMTEKKANMDAPLTDQQKETVQKEFNDISEAKKQYEEKIAKLEAENARLQAERKLPKSSVPKSSKERLQKLSDERKEIFTSIKDKLKKARGEANVTPIPYAKELFVIAPDVAKLVKNVVDTGITKLADVVTEIHGKLKEDIPEITEKDVHDLIAGVYNEKKKTRSELATQVYDLKRQAQLVNKLEALLRGEEPKSEPRKVRRNQEIEALKKQIKDVEAVQKAINEAKESKEKPSPKESSLNAYKKNTENKIKELEYKLKTGDFDAESKPKKEPLKLDKEAQELKDKLIKLKQEREVRLLKQEYANRSKQDRYWNNALEVMNVPRTIMSSMDYSAPLRQGIIASLAHPRTAAKAGIEMFKQSVSQKRFDRWFYDLKESPQYKIMQESGLHVSDPHDPKLSAKEEAFMNNLSEKIPVIGRLVKGSERAYVGYLNKMRVDLFNRFAERFEKDGRTLENSPELYKGLADYINNSTGRGKLPWKLEDHAPLFNSLFFSPRLIASRLNLLNPFYYAKLPKEVRMMAAKDMFKFMALGMSALALAKLNGADVEDDPRSSDFGKIKSGNTRWDIWGGFQPYIRLATQVFMGERKSSATGEIQKLDGKGAFHTDKGDVVSSFFRGKLAPVPSMIWDFTKGTTVTGDKVTVGQEAESHLLPLIYSDLKDAYKEKGIEGLFTVGIPSTFGVSAQTYLPREKERNKPERRKPKRKPQPN